MNLFVKKSLCCYFCFCFALSSKKMKRKNDTICQDNQLFKTNKQQTIELKQPDLGFSRSSDKHRKNDVEKSKQKLAPKKMVVKLPVHNKHKEIVAHTKVDADKAEDVKRGSLTLAHGYVQIRINGVKIELSHFIGGKPPQGQYKDHIDNNILNNTRDNLRDLTPAQNSRNQRKRVGCSSQYIGVTKLKKTGMWLAQIKVYKGKKNSRSFAIELDAAKWYDNATMFHHRRIHFIPKTNGTLTENEFENPTKPKVRKSNFPKYVDEFQNGFRVGMVNADGKRIYCYPKTLEEATKKAIEMKAEIVAEIERRHLSIPITYDDDSNPYITLNNTLSEDIQKRVKVDAKFWHKLTEMSWNCSDSDGYPSGARKEHGTIRLHLFIWELSHPDEKRESDFGYEIDHVDQNKLNCISENLERKKKADNNRNKRKQAGKTSKYKGVCWAKRQKKWVATISINGTTEYIGCYDNEKDAADAYQVKLKKFLDEFNMCKKKILERPISLSLTPLF